MKTTFKLLTIAILFCAGSAQAQWNDHDDGDGGMFVVERQILCESHNYNTATCGTGLERTRDIYLSHQVSKASCIQGSTYSFYGDRIQVSGGCRAYFVARGRTQYPLSSDTIIAHPQPLVTVSFQCESQNYNPATCAIPLRRVRDVYLSQQLSKSACIEGSSYTLNDRYVHVSQGCRAVFTARGVR